MTFIAQDRHKMDRVEKKKAIQIKYIGQWKHQRREKLDWLEVTCNNSMHMRIPNKARFTDTCTHAVSSVQLQNVLTPMLKHLSSIVLFTLHYAQLWYVVRYVRMLFMLQEYGM